MDLCYYHYHFYLCAACNIKSTLAINSSQQNSFRECLCGIRSLVQQNHNHRLSFHKHNRSLFSHTFSWEKNTPKKATCMTSSCAVSVKFNYVLVRYAVNVAKVKCPWEDHTITVSRIQITRKLWIKKLFRFMKPSIILRTLSMDDLFANSLNNT